VIRLNLSGGAAPRLALVVAGFMLFAVVTQSEVLRREGAAFGNSADWPLRFKRHMFGAICFNTATCSIRYHNFEHGTANPTPVRPAAAEHDRRTKASFGDIRNFSPPAVLTWHPRGGGQLQAEVDLAAIFGDGLIRHAAQREDIADGVSMGLTHIVIEIDDRTVRVYTRTMIPLKQPRIPGNRFSHFRDDLIRVYSKTY
jgi:hypothetical protein